MWYIITSELRKLLFSGRGLCLLLVLSLMNVFLIYLKQDQSFALYEAADYRNLYQQFEQEEPEIILEQLKTMQKENMQDFSKAPVYTNSSYGDYSLISTLINEVEAVVGYEQYREQVAQNADRILSGFWGVQKGSFSYRNAQKTKADFAEMATISTAVGPEKGIDFVLDFAYTDWLILAFSVYCVFTLFTREREQGSLVLTGTTKFGGKKHAFCKLTAVIIAVAFVFTVLYVLNFCVVGVVFGYGDLGRTLQSIESMMNSTLVLSVAQYFCVFLFAKLFTLGAVCCLLFFLACAIKAAYRLFFVLIVFGGAEFLLYHLISEHSVGSVFHFINLFAFLNTKTVIGIYRNINLFEVPVAYPMIFIIVLLIVYMLSVIAGILLYERNPLAAVRNRVGAKKARGCHVSIMLHELFKQLVCGRSLIVFVLFFVMLPTVIGEGKEIISSKEEMIYKKYMNAYEGKVDASKRTLLEEEKKRLDAIYAEMQRAYSEADNDIVLSYLESFYNEFQVEYKVFYSVLEHADYLEQCGGEFLYETGYKVLLGKISYQNRNGILAIFMMLFISVVCAYCYGGEYQDNTLPLIHTTGFGRVRIYLTKTWYAFGSTTLMYLLLYLTYLYRIIQNYGSSGISAPLKSIEEFSGWNITIVEALLLIFLVRYFVYLVSTQIIFGISRVLKNYNYTVLVGSAILCGGTAIWYWL